MLRRAESRSVLTNLDAGAWSDAEVRLVAATLSSTEAEKQVPRIWQRRRGNTGILCAARQGPLHPAACRDPPATVRDTNPFHT